MSTTGSTNVMDRLGIGKESFRAMGLLPLVHVAWADGAVQMAERSVIVDFARDKGWLASGEEELLTQWLTKAPSVEDALDGARAIAALARDDRALGSSVPLRTSTDILLACHDVATASGGLFGLRPAVSSEESVALQDVADALGIDPGAQWTAIIESLNDKASESTAPGSDAHFLMGHVPDMMRDPLDLFLRTWQRFGDVARLRLGPTVVAHLVVHPDHVKHVLVDNNRNYVRDPIFDELERVFGEGLLTSDGELWRRQRRIMQPAFHMKKIAAMAQTMVDSGQELVKRLAESGGKHVDLADEMARISLQIASKTLFGAETAEEAARLAQATTTMLAHVAARSRSLVKLPESVPTTGNRRFREAMDLLDSTVFRAIDERRKSQVHHDDLLSMLMDARDEDTGEGMTKEQLRTEVLTLLLAGSETTAVALTWAWAQVSTRPMILREVRAELDRVLGDRPPKLEDLAALVYTSAVLDEAMRLRPPAWMISRKAVAEDSLGGKRIPAASMVYMSPYLTHRHPDFWENPEAFDPTRFLPENEGKRHPFAYMPFGGGPRKCIGVAFAMMEMKLLFAMMARAVDLTLVAGFEVEREPSLTLRARNGCWMTAQPRKR